MGNRGIYDIIYWTGGLVGIFVIYRSMVICYGSAITKGRVEVRKRLVVAMIGIAAILLTEAGSRALVCSVVTGEWNESSLALGAAESKLLLLLLFMLFKGLKHAGKYLCGFLFVPVFSAYFIGLIFQKETIGVLHQTLCTVGVLGMNTAVAYLCELLSDFMSDKAEKEVLEQQNQTYREQVEAMQASMLAAKSQRHDLKNHFISLEHLLSQNETDAAQRYIENLLKETQRAGAVHSGNMAVDSILSAKLQKAKAEDIEVTTAFLIPEKLPIATEDIVIILGNVVDNALEAVQKLPMERRRIAIDIKYDRNQLFISVANTFDGKVEKKKDCLLTTKKDKENHGIGIYNVKKTIKKYNGWLEQSCEGDVFVTYAGLYVK